MAILCSSWCILVYLIGISLGKCLLREPPDIDAPPQQTDGGFYLEISGNPKYYEPGHLYTVSLTGDITQFQHKQFTEFLLVVESVVGGGDIQQNALEVNNAEAVEEVIMASSKRTGSFQLLGDVLTRFSDHCTNTVTQTSSVAKSEIQVLWTAPPAGSGCVAFKAMVVENKGFWAIDSGRLTFQLCEAEIEEHSTPDEIIEPCCACEEAKYEVTFEGLWSDKTHPKDFPMSKWLLHFSDIIGASHSAGYRVWEYGGQASKGLAQVAKWGSARVLESELKAESRHIRTIIKSRGLWSPNVNGKTFAVFRTDKRNHLVSLVSMLGPSPDWIVGVSGLELCQKNCTWMESKELFLYPWDAGVDSGISYESPDQPTEPQQNITRITSRFPDDPRQPFWNETGAPMKPLAKLSLTRQRLYRKSCIKDNDIPFQETIVPVDLYEDHQGANSIFEDLALPGCEASEWSSWSACSVTCGKGISMRTRSFLIPEKAQMLGCDRQMVQREMCSATILLCEDSGGFYSEAPDDFVPDDMCATTEWSGWSPCSTTCGKGYELRTRRFYNRMGRKKCPHVDTMERRNCAGSVAVCPNSYSERYGSGGGGGILANPDCAVTSWSDWSPCSVSCGKGLKVRTRLYMVSPEQQSNVDCKVKLMEKAMCQGSSRSECEFDAQEARQICSMPKEPGPCRAKFLRWHFDSEQKKCMQFRYGGCRGNSNNFEQYMDCTKLCESQASQLFPESTTLTSIDLSVYDDTGGSDYYNEDPYGKYSHLVANKEENWQDRKRRMMEEERQRQLKDMMMSKQEPVPSVDCVVTAWSPWSDCSATCGRGFRRKFRMIKRHHSGNGQKCPRKLEKRQKCKLPVCEEDCILSEWAEWGPCSESCGSDGQQERQKPVAHEGRVGGRPCGPRIERRICLLESCPLY